MKKNDNGKNNPPGLINPGSLTKDNSPLQKIKFLKKHKSCFLAKCLFTVLFFVSAINSVNAQGYQWTRLQENIYSNSFSRTNYTILGSNGTWSDGNTKEKAFDGNIQTFFDAAEANGQWVGLDLGKVKVIDRIVFMPRKNWQQRMVGGKFQISTTADFSGNVIDLYILNEQNMSYQCFPEEPITSIFPLAIVPGSGGKVSARYVRYFSPNDGRGNIAEMQVQASDPPANVWNFTGNAGTTSANFIGTTDNNPLIIRSKNNVAVQLSNQLVAIGSHEPKARLDISGGNDADPKINDTNPAIGFEYTGSGGGFKHWINSRHNAAANSTGNAIEFYLNNSNTSAGSSSTLQGTRHGMSITAAGVGIGTPSPVANLDIFDLLETPKDNGGSKEMLRLGRTGTSGYKWPMSVSFGLGSYAPGLNPQSKLDIKLGNGGQGNPDVTVMTLAGNGNVAISNQIQIKGGNPGAGKVLTAIDGSGLAIWQKPRWTSNFGAGYNSYNGTQLLFMQNGTYTYMHAINTRHNGGGKSGNAFDFFVWKQGTDGTDVAGTQHVMTLDGTGYVGIGTKSPTKLLEIGADKAGVTEVQLLVHGGAKFNNDADADHLTQVTINTNKRIAGIALTVGGPTYIGSYANADASINIGQLKDYYLWVEKGIVSEDYAIANATTWKDEVFTKGYKLPTLGEVEKFIAENKHLPGVPSGKEIKENGYTLHQVTLIFLEKIEQLTLYSIKRQKTIDAQEETIKELENEAVAIQQLQKQIEYLKTAVRNRYY